ncbi:MucR family transcriptional regulator [Methylorubrum extorquens]|jgi:predicted transcriptional regulator|uniref:MucR family transcriptional regulator n=1 Tax=Methylorubrum extorquens TaxID=408 RepID=A0A1S1NV69_METEX|nr:MULTISPECIES: MucR family transcriptional regulator [Methylorubrum]MDF9861336.1 putative transcriptional regulator [Methylorubrum pseudosasae]MDH6634965.1 putative transcriptional regulator [Methylobacterium sp. SuP10 SLI 274]MDH6664134.1 putative transcriptional regulator [Methylorubrum zatmanii]MCP1561140.1 putative transcriptional regulator [Methylorubrum extorquens]MDF9789621.1 putative transcriptional regulator [Methylorubrum extorquens]
MEDSTSPDLLTMTADIVAAFVSNNSVPASELPNLLVQVHGAFASLLATSSAEAGSEIEKPTPAQIKKSITPDALISFVDGKPYRTLKRHLTVHGLSVDEYRTRYGLPSDYPSVSANYSATRSALAKQLGLGNQRKKVEPAPAPEPEPTPASKSKRAGRPRKVAEPA